MADMTIASFSVDNSTEINMAQVQSWRAEIALIDNDIHQLTYSITLAQTTLNGANIALANYQNIPQKHKIARFFGFDPNAVKKLKSFDINRIFETERRYIRTVNKSQKNLDNLNAKMDVLKARRTSLQTSIDDHFKKYQDKGGLDHFRKVGDRLKVRDGVINFGTASGIKLLNKMLTNSNPPKVNQAQYRKLMELIAKYPASLVTIPTKYLDAMKNTDVEMTFNNGTNTVTKNVNGYDAISRTAYAGMRLAERQGNEKIVNSKSQLEAFDQANRTRYRMPQQGTPSNPGTDLNKEELDFT